MVRSSFSLFYPCFHSICHLLFDLSASCLFLPACAKSLPVSSPFIQRGSPDAGFPLLPHHFPWAPLLCFQAIAGRAPTWLLPHLCPLGWGDEAGRGGVCEPRPVRRRLRMRSLLPGPPSLCPHVQRGLCHNRLSPWVTLAEKKGWWQPWGGACFSASPPHPSVLIPFSRIHLSLPFLGRCSSSCSPFTSFL